MDERYEHYEGLLETTRQIRLALMTVPADSHDAKQLRTELCDVLLARADMIIETATLGLPPLVEDDAEPLWREAAELVEELLPEAPEGSGRRHRLCWLAAQGLRIEALLFERALPLDDLIRWLEAALAPPMPPPDMWWDPDVDRETRGRLGLLYSQRFSVGDAADDRGRIVELLGPLADVGAGAGVADADADAEAEAEADPADRDEELLALVWTALASALASTARDPETGEVLPPLDEVRAAYLWQKAAELDVDPELKWEMLAEQGRLRWKLLDWSRPDASEELHAVLALLRPLIDEADANADIDAGAEVLELCTVLVRDLLHHDPSPEHRMLVVEWYRLTVNHPGWTAEELRGYREDLALALVEIVIEEEWPETDPRRLALLREALTYVDAVHAELVATLPDGDEMDHVKPFLFDVLARLDHNGVEAEVTDRAIALGSELLATVRPEDSMRAELYIRVGGLIFQRSYRRLVPYFDPLRYDTGLLASPYVMTVGSSHPELVADFARAADLVRTGLSRYPVQDEFYPMGALIIGYSLPLHFLMLFPHGDRALLRESLEWQRKIHDLNPQDWVVSLAERQQMLLLTVSALLMTDTSLRGMEAPPGTDADFSIEAMTPALAEELFLARRLIEAILDETADPDPAFVFLGFYIDIRGWNVRPPSPEQLDMWARRLRQALHRADESEAVQRLILQTMIVMVEAARELAAGADLAAIRSAAAEVRAVRAVVPEGLGAQHLDRFLAMIEDEPAIAMTQFAGMVETMLRGPVEPVPTAPRLPVLEAEPVRPGVFGVVAASAAPLLGDGSESPFIHPPGLVVETVDRLYGPADADGAADNTADGAREPVPATLTALALHVQWLRQRDPADISLAVRLAGSAASRFVAAEPELADRVNAVLAGLLHDRYLLYGDHADLEAARSLWSALLETTSDGPRPGLAVLLNAAAAEDEVLGVRELFRADLFDDGPFRAELLAFAGLADLAAADLAARDDGAELVAEDGGLTATQLRALGLDRLTSALAGLGARHPLRPAALGESALVRWTEAGRRSDAAARIVAAADIAAAAAACAESSQHRPGLLLRAAAVAAAHLADAQTRESGLVLAADIVQELSEVTRGSSALYYGGWARCQYGLGELLAARHRVTGDPEDLARAIAALAEAENVHGPASADPFAAALKRSLASAYRMGAEDPAHRRRSRVAARSVMWAHGRAVLLQSGTRRALEAARRAGDDAARLVRWCLADDDTAGALEAVELGRGLTLHAATVASTVPALLVAAGHPGLAAEWRAVDAAATGTADIASIADAADNASTASTASTGSAVAGTADITIAPSPSDSVPDDLRRRVLLAVEGSPAERRLLSAPSPAETGRALVAVGADAFVYLLADTGTDTGGRNGHALVVDASGAVRTVAIAGLSVDSPELTAYAAAVRARDATAPAAGVEDRWHQALLHLCAWTGRMMAPVLENVRASVTGRAPRLVLVPVGPLGMVPWHAGALPTSTGPTRYVCQDAVVSYCATARQLVEVADRPRMPVTGPAVMVVDPEGSSIAKKEAVLIRYRFYPDAEVLGSLGFHPHQRDPAWRQPEPRPALADVLDPYLPGRGPTSAAVTIANCHAVSTVDASSSRLILYYDRRTEPGRVLTVDRLLSGALGRDPQAPGGLVVLADCVTDLAVARYDESVTLATAVLAAGACSVVGSKWAIADQPQTTVLMYMFHHFLHDAGGESAGSPADALRAAQMWMLDPDRVTPDGADEAAFARLEEKNLADPVFWAAFTHHGH
ncbi:CHAT domain-containing protein [Catenulispora rubra]|uniref:CHAT domain-containing protein n=1 Tax=Catenulispora rubra TaxID=280293 RepID=UPI0018923309|nr:CHAT domain-containing protein [Catenulispora rubra]